MRGANQHINKLQSELRTSGFCFVRELPESTSPCDFLQHFGKIRTQTDGSLFYQVKAGNYLQPSLGESIMPHTDEFNCEQNPPKIVALQCITPSEDGGMTCVADGYSWLKQLGTEDKILLSSTWTFKKAESSTRLPVLSQSMGQKILRISFGHLQFSESESMKRIMNNLLDWFRFHSVAIQHSRNSLLIWNNWRIIHGRTSYTNISRELHRYYLE